MDEWEREFGAQIRRARLLEDITQDDLARRAHVSVGTLVTLEGGKGSSFSTVIRVVRALGREEWLASFEPKPVVSPLALAREQRGLTEPRRASRRS
ncbi:helix-turn-helix domain-containing protein [Microbacterium sp. No. 7]|uniref:helix-turn-helix domain-containing protein n=1 Tax=Microbacterium sp. No. 7 TaxID=1714373 RepID=UPI0006D261CC|nr:helix-turn-helix domain-containing protein [Microbacterium sp. No. 7]